MNKELYEKLSKPFQENAAAAQALRIADKVLTSSFYVLYPILLVLLLLEGLSADAPFSPHLRFLPCVIAPAIGIVAVSLLRKAVNAPRPYEALAISPIIKKDTRGQSFPSKHVFSSFCIATCWLSWSTGVGCVLLAAAICIACVRVVGGVHWPRDVAAGAALGIACGLVVLFW